MASTAAAAATPTTKTQKRKRDADNGSLIQLNVGGVLFTTTRDTLRLSPFFRAMFDSGMQPGLRDHQERIFIDFDPKGFRPLLEYLRTNQMPKTLIPSAIAAFKYFQVSPPKQYRQHGVRTLSDYQLALSYFCEHLPSSASIQYPPHTAGELGRDWVRHCASAQGKRDVTKAFAEDIKDKIGARLGYKVCTVEISVRSVSKKNYGTPYLARLEMCVKKSTETSEDEEK